MNPVAAGALTGGLFKAGAGVRGAALASAIGAGLAAASQVGAAASSSTSQVDALDSASTKAVTIDRVQDFTGRFVLDFNHHESSLSLTKSKPYPALNRQCQKVWQGRYSAGTQRYECQLDLVLKR